jgi:hypothetical protein
LSLQAADLLVELNNSLAQLGLLALACVAIDAKQRAFAVYRLCHDRIVHPGKEIVGKLDRGRPIALGFVARLARGIFVKRLGDDGQVGARLSFVEAK